MRRVGRKVVDMARRETPLWWVPVLEAAGLHSARDLARELDVSPQTAVRLVHGEQTSRETIEAAATLLGVTPERIRELREEESLPPFRLPPEADRLGPKQRTAVVAVVRAMLELADAATKTRAASAADSPTHEESIAARDVTLAALAEVSEPVSTITGPPKRSPRRK